ncbi:MAG: EAL domain-containing protein [Acidimicrobiales bacterium]
MGDLADLATDTAVRVLLVEDSPGDASLIVVALEQGDFEVVHVETLALALSRLDSDDSFGCVLVDLGLPDASELEAVDALLTRYPGLPIVAITGNTDAELGLAAMRNGAQDYLTKHEIDDATLSRAMRYAIERQNVRGQIRDVEARFRVIVENVSDVFLVIAPAGTLDYVNPAVRTVSGLDPSALHGTSLFAHVPIRQHESLAGALAAAVASEGAVVSFSLRREDGGWCVLEGSARAMRWGAEDRVVVVARDVSDRQRLEAELAERRIYDPLTGLPNQALLHDRVAQAVKRRQRTGKAFAVAFLGLDGFAELNSAYGHEVGDQVLVAVARRLESALRDTDIVVRYAGDQFCVVFEPLEHSLEAVARADALLAELGRPMDVDDHSLYLRASVGLAVVADGLDDHHGLLQAADSALSRAKADGGSRVFTWHDSLHARARERTELGAALRDAVDRGLIEVAFQPIVELRTGQICGAEALARWSCTPGTHVAPDVFVTLAEEIGLARQLDDGVLALGLAQLARWRTDGLVAASFQLSVNRSPAHMADQDVAADVRRALEKASVPADCLAIELTETALARDIEAVSQRVRDLDELGVNVAIDDFGTGYSSLAYLRTLPIDALKIDRVFVAGLGRDRRDSAIVSTVVSLGVALGCDVVAEGVEETRQLDQLRALGATRAQGYLISEPLGAAEFADLMTSGRTW